VEPIGATELIFLLFVPALVVVLAIYWLREFVQLMLLSDDDLPGRYDKVAWALAFAFLPFLAPFAFSAWKKGYVTLRRPTGFRPDR